MDKYSKTMKRMLAIVLSVAMIVPTALLYTPVEAEAAVTKKVIKSLSVASKVTVTAGAKKTVSAKVTALKSVKASDLKVKVSTSNKKIVTASISKNPTKKGKTGTSSIKLTAKKAGTAYVTVKTVSTNKKNKTVTKKIKVTVKSVPVKSVKASISSKTIIEGQKAQINASVLPSNATDKKLTYTSSNTAVATVNQAGLVEGVSAGNATITIKSSNGKKKVINVTVEAENIPVGTFTLSEEQKGMKKGETFTLVANIAPSNATDKSVKWSSDNEEVATVDDNGTVTAIAAGKAVIKAVSSNDKVATCTVNVTEDVKVEGITLSSESINLFIPGKQQLSATVKPDNAADKAVTWESSNTAVATVTSNGLVTSVSAGEAVITATTNDGKYKATCAVKVFEGSVDNAAKVTIGVANSLSDYANTVLTGTYADVRIQVLNAINNPVANTEVAISYESEYTSGHDSEFAIVTNGTLTNTVALKTDENGYVNISFGLRNANAYKSTDEVYESFKMTAKVTGSDVSATESVSFACIRMGGIRVMNNRRDSLSDLAPHTNAVAKSWNTVANTWSLDGYRNNEYVTNQMHSSDTVDHSVTLSATPVIIVPAKNDNQHYGDFTKEINYDSGDYEVYNTANEEENDDTTCWIKELPAGIKTATVHFKDVVLSEYTILKITVYNADSGAVLQTEVKDKSNLTVKNYFDFQIQVQENVPMNVCVSLESEGQVNLDSNDGYKITYLEGKYANTNKTDGVEHEIGSVEWEKVDKQYDSLVTMDYNWAKKYISDTKFLDKDYKYSYEVPTFPRTGDAYIYVQDKNDKIIGIFSYPTENTWINYDDTSATLISDRTIYPTSTDTNDKSHYTLPYYYGITDFNYDGVIDENVISSTTKNMHGMYANKNDIKIKQDYDYNEAVNVSQNEADRTVGEIKTDGNECIVDSKETGSTIVKATVKVSSMGNSSLTEFNGAELFSSVQWSPLPEDEETDDIQDFYAIRTQTVKVVAQVVDKSTQQILSTPDLAVKFYSGEDEILSNGSLVTNSKVNVKDLSLNTDKDGKAYISFTSSDVAGFVSDLNAKCENYDVVFYVGRYNEECKRCNINWIDLGLEFTDRVPYEVKNGSTTVQYKNYTTSTLNGEHNAKSYDNDGKGTTLVDTLAKRPVGTNWMFGYKVVGKIDTGTGLFVDSIDNVNVGITQAGETGMTLTTDKDDAELENGQCKVYSEKNISTQIIGHINAADSYTDESKEASNVEFTLRDLVTNEVVGTFKNAGVGTPGIDEKLSIGFQWEEVGMKAYVLLPNGINVGSGFDTEAYIQVEDNFGNPLKGKKVQYTLSGIVNKAETTETTDDYGRIKISITDPGTTGDITIGAKVNETLSVPAATITYKDTTNTVFDVVGTRIEKNSDGKNYIKIVYTSDIKPETVRKELFVVKSSVDDKTYTVNNVSVDSTYRNVLNLELDDNDAVAITNDTGVISVYTNKITVKDVKYNLTDTNGRYLPADNNVVCLAPKTTFTLEAKWDEAAGEIVATIYDDMGKDISWSLNPKYGNVYAYSQNKAVLGGNGYVVNSYGGGISANKQDNAETVYVYYCGYTVTVTVPAK